MCATLVDDPVTSGADVRYSQDAGSSIQSGRDHSKVVAVLLSDGAAASAVVLPLAVVWASLIVAGNRVAYLHLSRRCMHVMRQGGLIDTTCFYITRTCFIMRIRLIYDITNDIIC